MSVKLANQDKLGFTFLKFDKVMSNSVILSRKCFRKCSLAKKSHEKSKGQIKPKADWRAVDSPKK